MSDPAKSVLLVALSEGFARPNLLASKLDRLIENLGDAEVILMQDVKGIARRYFESRDIAVRDERIASRMQTRSLVAQCSHVVVFWGGDIDLNDVMFFAKSLRKHYRLITLPITTVRNKKRDEEFDIYIGRGSKWGNPFEISQGPNGMDRDEVIKRYKEHFEREILPNPDMHSHLLSLRGYRLGCFCKPEKCHGDIIADYLNSYGDSTDSPDDQD
ncbi:DUF4326 domain-containing protein [Paraburkholderia bannensis]|uniref:DUF4326 domain-containing protein n=1 Tax=Paraburkholderia bannensis TaxID=765414 RepID=UPI002AC3411E|nr:DUF4326 domain-containing protein [Paraburkholderia bannensis]